MTWIVYFQDGLVEFPHVTAKISWTLGTVIMEYTLCTHVNPTWASPFTVTWRQMAAVGW